MTRRGSERCDWLPWLETAIGRLKIEAGTGGTGGGATEEEAASQQPPWVRAAPAAAEGASPSGGPGTWPGGGVSVKWDLGVEDG